MGARADCVDTGMCPSLHLLRAESVTSRSPLLPVAIVLWFPLPPPLASAAAAATRRMRTHRTDYLPHHAIREAVLRQQPLPVLREVERHAGPEEVGEACGYKG